MKKVGALWVKEKDGRKYMTGEIDLGALGNVKIGVFQNDKKKKDNEPDSTVVVFTE